MAHHAKKGGEIGANGEFYKGGQFVADSEETIKGERKRKPSGSRKIQIEPYKWVEAGQDDISLFSLLVFGVVKWEDWKKKDRVVLTKDAEEICLRSRWSLASHIERMNLFNAGVRIISSEERDRILNLK